MPDAELTIPQQLAKAASELHVDQTGHAPKAVAVVLAGDTLVVTLHEALSPAEQAMAKNPAGAAQVQEFHRQLFRSSSAPMRDAIQRITGVRVRDAAAEVEINTGTIIHAFTGGTVVQVFLLADHVSEHCLSGSTND